MVRSDRLAARRIIEAEELTLEEFNRLFEEEISDEVPNDDEYIAWLEALTDSGPDYEWPGNDWEQQEYTYQKGK